MFRSSGACLPPAGLVDSGFYDTSDTGSDISKLDSDDGKLEGLVVGAEFFESDTASDISDPRELVSENEDRIAASVSGGAQEPLDAGLQPEPGLEQEIEEVCEQPQPPRKNGRPITKFDEQNVARRANRKLAKEAGINRPVGRPRKQVITKRAQAKRNTADAREFYSRSLREELARVEAGDKRTSDNMFLAISATKYGQQRQPAG